MKEVNSMHISGARLQYGMPAPSDDQQSELDDLAERIARIDPDIIAKFFNRMATSMGFGTEPPEQKWHSLAGNLRTCGCAEDALKMCEVIAHQADFYRDERALRLARTPSGVSQPQTQRLKRLLPLRQLKRKWSHPRTLKDRDNTDV
jgi:hypothetical protein